VNHVLPAWDLLTGAYAAFALVSAERARRAGGGGREVRIPLSDVAAGTLSNLGQVAEVMSTGQDRPRQGNDLFGAFGRDFVTADGRRLMVVAITARQWRGVLKTLGLTETVAALEAEVGVSFAEHEGVRHTWRERLNPLFEQAFAARTAAELAPAFEAEGVCWSTYRSLREAVAETPELFADNPIFAAADHPSGLDYPAAGAFTTVAGTPRAPVRPAPRLGADTDQVLAQMLGLSAGEIARLHDAGVVAGPR
jgi:2-methylfumaryl-CoA isomerase